MGNSVNRLSSAGHLYKSIFSTRSKPPRQIRLSHLKSPLLFSHGKRLCRPLSMVHFYTRQNKVIQGQQTSGVWISANFVDVRRYSSGNQCYSEGSSAEEVGKMDMMDVAIPNNAWNSETCELYKSLRQELFQQTDGDWCEHRSNIYCGENRLFTKAVVTELPGKFFEYRFFFSQKRKSLKGVIQFGPYTQGPPGCVHGGASASMVDAAVGVCVNRLYTHCVTANLSINYKRLLPLGAATLVETWIDKEEGRKVFASAELKSPDRNVTYVTATAIYIKLDSVAQSKDVKEKMDQLYKR